MKKLLLVVAAGALVVGCGEKLQEAKEAANALEQLAEAGKNIEQATNEAETFMKERRAKGDTVAMTADQLKTFLPTAIDGYRPKEEPSVQQTTMDQYSFTIAEQEWVSTSSPDTNNPARIKVSLTDWGGTEGGHALYYAPFMINIKTENAQERSGNVDLGLPFTAARETFRKESKDATIAAVTRYRYFINIEATNQADDVTPTLTTIAKETAGKFADK